MNNGNGNKKRQNNEESDDGVDLDYPQFNDNDENAENGIDLQEQINQFQKFRQRAQLAKKLGGFNNNERVMGTDKKEIDKGKQTDQYMRQIQKGMDQLMDDDDLLMLQEMKRRKEQKLKANQASSNTGGNVSGDKNKRVQLYIDQD